MGFLCDDEATLYVTCNLIRQRSMNVSERHFVKDRCIVVLNKSPILMCLENYNNKTATRTTTIATHQGKNIHQKTNKKTKQKNGCIIGVGGWGEMNRRDQKEHMCECCLFVCIHIGMFVVHAKSQ